MRDRVSGALLVPADYTEVGELLIAATVIGLVLPLAAVGIAKLAKLRTA